MNILGIETSCDETAAAIVRTESNKVSVLANVVSSQVKLHAKWGGVVPNLAAREHEKNIIPVLEKTFSEAGVAPKNIDLIAVTQGPGLIPALLVGTNVAKTLSYLWKKPLVGIHHIEGHIYANYLTPTLSLVRRGSKGEVKFPVLCLVVSGGHTQLVLMKKHLDYKIIGQTLDDAAGEAFDKVARILGLGYPGGPAIAAEATKLNSPYLPLKIRGGIPSLDSREGEGEFSKIKLPRPLINSNDFNFSFSGLKTAVLYTVKKISNKRLRATGYRLREHLCADFQQAVIDVLVAKTIKAAKKYNPKTIMLAGGVSANLELRKQLGEAVKKNLPRTEYQIPDTVYSLDNAAMVAAAAYFRWKNMSAASRKNLNKNWSKLEADSNLKLA